MKTIFNWYAIIISLVLTSALMWLFTGDILHATILAPLWIDGLLLIEIWHAAKAGV